LKKPELREFTHFGNTYESNPTLFNKYHGNCIAALLPTMLKIQKSENQGVAIFALSGSFDGPQIPELKKLLDGQGDTTEIVIDMEEVRLVDREAVRFLAACKSRGIRLTNCSSYISEWMGTRRNDDYEL
jgi:hypothetical protein